MGVEAWDQATDEAWDGLQQRLAKWLGNDPGDDTVVIELGWPGGEDDGAAPYVQLFVEDVYVHAEAASNRHLATRFRLDKPRRKMLRGLGWQRPNDDVANYWSEWELPEDADELAALLVESLRHVYGVPAPLFLSVGYFAPDGSLAGEEKPLGLARTEPRAPALDLSAVKADGPDHLRDLAAAALDPVLEGEVEFDPDGDIPVLAGNTVIYVRVEEDAPAIRLFGWLLHDVKWTPRVGHTLNDFNKRLNVVRLVHHDNHIMLSAQLMCVPFVPESLRQHVMGVSSLVDGLDLRLQERIGGLLMTETAHGETA